MFKSLLTILILYTIYHVNEALLFSSSPIISSLLNPLNSISKITTTNLVVPQTKVNTKATVQVVSTPPKVSTPITSLINPLQVGLPTITIGAKTTNNVITQSLAPSVVNTSTSNPKSSSSTTSNAQTSTNSSSSNTAKNATTTSTENNKSTTNTTSTAVKTETQTVDYKTQMAAMIAGLTFTETPEGKELQN